MHGLSVDQLPPTEVIEDISPESVGATRRRSRIVSLSELLDRDPPQYLVNGIIVEAGLILLYAAPGVGKTFLALDFACCIAAGVDWNGRAVREGKIVYIAAEGSSGLGPRIEAWCGGDVPQESRLHEQFNTIDSAVDFLEREDSSALIDDLLDLPEKPKLVIIDTLARCLTGDENAARDVGQFIRACDEIRQSVGAAVMIVHHTGKTGDLERGSSALRGATDAIMKLEPSGEGLTLRCDKQKEDEPFEPIELELEQLELNRKRDGIHLRSCRIRLKTGGTNGHSSQGGLGRDHRKICETLWDSFFEDGASSSQLASACKVPRSRYYRALKVLVDDGYVDRSGEGRANRYTLNERGKSEFVPLVPIRLNQNISDSGTLDDSSHSFPPSIEGREDETNVESEDGVDLEGSS